MLRKIERIGSLFILILLTGLLGYLIVSCSKKEVLLLPIACITLGSFLIIIIHQK